MTPEVTFWPPRADIYTCTLKSILIHRERKMGGEEGMEVEKKKERRGREEVYVFCIINSPRPSFSDWCLIRCRIN